MQITTDKLDKRRQAVIWDRAPGKRAEPGPRAASPLHMLLAQKLAHEIVSGQRLPGDVLPTELDMSISLAISRTAVREAIRILSAKGLVEPRPKRGTCVTEKTSWNLLDPDVIGWMFADTPEDRLVRNLFELRLIIEPAAASLAAQRRTVTHLAAMSNALDVMAQATLFTEAGRQADKDFHAALLAAADNDQLASLNASIGASVALSTRYKIAQDVLGPNPVLAHRVVYDAIACGDAAEARWCMESLIRQAMKDIVKRPQYGAMDSFSP
ncbi:MULTISPECIES: FadR/GntR family transcriptional regulator [Asticcacaulis]|uniref:FadR/GntR family transcriptional regulator n=1 Tax=Asticcacaulis TaxID=76890 RepID=UPI001AE7B54C|nr:MULTISPECIES: FadR/GntR family transcriptional regulator [Asticcacaulis]MBP2158813.1 DNA-binding FadR family transcriptional regulator [Asticcacaulis solisilvae]MDR6799859.1 DNA-binding FadR family transcriptional regulator [Asticcacaulis sp. BE141]